MNEHMLHILLESVTTQEGVQGDGRPEALVRGVPHRRQLKGNTPPQGVQGSPCRGLGCPQKPLFFSFSLGAFGSKREREGVFKGHRPLDPLKLTPMGVSPQFLLFSKAAVGGARGGPE